MPERFKKNLENLPKEIMAGLLSLLLLLAGCGDRNTEKHAEPERVPEAPQATQVASPSLISPDKQAEQEFIRTLIDQSREESPEPPQN